MCDTPWWIRRLLIPWIGGSDESSECLDGRQRGAQAILTRVAQQVRPFDTHKSIHPLQELGDEHWRIATPELQLDGLPLRGSDEHRIEREVDLLDRIGQHLQVACEENQLRPEERVGTASIERGAILDPTVQPPRHIVDEDQKIGGILFFIDGVDAREGESEPIPPCLGRHSDDAEARLAIVPRVHRRILPLVCSAVLLVLPLLPARAEPLPKGLPGHFGLGLHAQPTVGGIYGWMPESGIPWDYAYQYLAGGVNTGQGWDTWNPDGTFVLIYARGAAQHGYTPMFPYYMLLNSNGPCRSAPRVSGISRISTRLKSWPPTTPILRC